jgi:DNA-binding transcriptional ArsR family regulator
MSPRPDTSIAGSAVIFAALGDETRLQVLGRLSKGGPMSITQLTEGSNVSRQAVTKHLNVLAEAGLVRDFREGRERMWELKTRQLEAAQRALVEDE